MLGAFQLEFNQNLFGPDGVFGGLAQKSHH